MGDMYQNGTGNVFGFLAAPDRASSLRSIAIALLKIRALEGMNCGKIAKVLDCSVDTVRNASNEEALLSFDHVARLHYLFPDQCETIRELMFPPSSKPSPADRFKRIDRELDALRREVGA